MHLFAVDELCSGVVMTRTDEDLAATTEALLVASRALVGVAARSLADAGDITLPQFRVLVVLTGPASVSVSDLAVSLDIHSSTATRMCDRLDRKGLIRRRPGVSLDRRETQVNLTAKGRRLVARVTERRRRDLAVIASAMSRKDRQHALAGLAAFAAAAGELPATDQFGWAHHIADELAVPNG